MQKGYDETRLHDDDSMDGHVYSTHTNPMATSATNDLGQLLGSTPPLSPAPGHESNLTSRAEWSVQKGYDETD